jgi:hypothetical protein
VKNIDIGKAEEVKDVEGDQQGENTSEVRGDAGLGLEESMPREIAFMFVMIAAIVQFELLYHRGWIMKSIEEIVKVPLEKIPYDFAVAIKHYEKYMYQQGDRPVWLS